jgi:hypothetical protein
MINAVRGWVVLVLVVELAFTGCSKPHVTLGVPPNPTPEQRVRTFYELRAVVEKTTTTRTCSTRGGCTTDVDKELRLANGTVVHHVSDLLPVVSPDSESARAIHAARRARTRVKIWTTAVFCAALVTLIAWSYTDDLRVFFAGGGAMAIGALLVKFDYDEATDLTGRANMSFNDGLAEQLYVCVDGLHVVPCETLPLPGTPSR